MKTSFLLKSSLLATTGVYILPQLLSAQTSTRPHIILIVSDQHRGDAMNCNGKYFCHFSAYGLLAEDGTLFTNGYLLPLVDTPALFRIIDRTFSLASWYARIRQGSHQYRYEMPRMLGDLNYYSFAW